MCLTNNAYTHTHSHTHTHTHMHMCTELQNLAELIGPYGIHYMGEKLMELVAAQVAEIKKLVIANQDTLIALYSSRDKPEIFNKLFKKLKSLSVIAKR